MITIRCVEIMLDHLSLIPRRMTKVIEQIILSTHCNYALFLDDIGVEMWCISPLVGGVYSHAQSCKINFPCSFVFI